MSKPKPDEYHEDGTRLFNPTKGHGVVFGDGAIEARWEQDGVQYRADRLPVGHIAQPKPVKAAKAAPATAQA